MNQDQLIERGNAIAIQALRNYRGLCRQKQQAQKLFAIQVALVSPYPLGEAITKEALQVYQQNLNWKIRTPNLDHFKVNHWKYETQLINELFAQQLVYQN